MLILAGDIVWTFAKNMLLVRKGTQHWSDGIQCRIGRARHLEGKRQEYIVEYVVDY